MHLPSTRHPHLVHKKLRLMYNRDMKKFAVLGLFALTSIFFLSCGNKKADSKNRRSAAADFSEESMAPVKKWTDEDGVICIVFGHEFNKPDFYADSVQKLSDYYGLSENGGLIMPLHFPTDFKNGIQGLRKLLEGVDLKGIIFLGAPDDTHEVLSKYQEMYGGEIPFPVISLFPQDNVLGQEATCTLIIDYERSAVEDKTENEVQHTTTIDAEEIFANTVRYLANLEGKFIKGKEIGAELKSIAKEIAGDDKHVRRYVDSGSGMQSLNHYTVESLSGSQKSPDSE